MSSEASHRGAAMNVVTELDLRQVLVEGLHELAQDDTALAELVQRVDTLRQGSQDEWTSEMTRLARALVDPSSEHSILVRIGYPTSAAHLPCIGVVLDQAGEDQGGALLGDRLDTVVRCEGAAPDRCKGAVFVNGVRVAPLPDPAGGEDYPAQDPPRRAYLEEVRGVDWRSTLEVSCWAPAPEISLLVQAMARWALFRGKGLLQRSGVHEVSFDEGGVQPDERLEPRVGYVPIIRVTLSWTYRQTLRVGRVATYEGGINLTNKYTTLPPAVVPICPEPSG